MARIRSIKPEFPQSESNGRLSRDARLLFILIWTLVDDEGRTRAASRMLASLLYPFDDDAADLIELWLVELERENKIIRYVVDGSHYLQVVNWLQHQKIDHPSKSRLPPPDSPLAKALEPSRTLAPDLGPRIKDQGEDSTESVERGVGRTKSKSKSKSKPKRGCQLPDDFVLDEPKIAFAKSSGLTISDLQPIFDQFCDHHRKNGSVMVDWMAAWRTWVRNEIKYSQQRRNGSHGGQPRRTVHDAAKDLSRRVQEFGEQPTFDLRNEAGGNPVRVLPPGRRE